MEILKLILTILLLYEVAKGTETYWAECTNAEWTVRCKVTEGKGLTINGKDHNWSIVEAVGNFSVRSNDTFIVDLKEN
jgi:hypothetical protein